MHWLKAAGKTRDRGWNRSYCPGFCGCTAGLLGRASGPNQFRGRVTAVSHRANALSMARPQRPCSRFAAASWRTVSNKTRLRSRDQDRTLNPTNQKAVVDALRLSVGHKNPSTNAVTTTTGLFTRVTL